MNGRGFPRGAVGDGNVRGLVLVLLVILGLVPCASVHRALRAQLPAPSRHIDAETDANADVVCIINQQPLRHDEFKAVLESFLNGQPLHDQPHLLPAVGQVVVQRYLALQSLLQRADQDFDDDLSLSQQWETMWPRYLQSQLTEENLRRFFAAQHAKYDGTRWEVSHLFRRPAPAEDQLRGSDTVSPQEFMRKISETIRRSAEPEQVFATEAKRFSQSVSADRSGRLGWVSAIGDLPPAVANELLDAQPGDIVGPIQSAMGWHLLLVHRRQAGERTFATQQHPLVLRRDSADALFAALVRKQTPPTIRWIDPRFQPPAAP